MPTINDNIVLEVKNVSHSFGRLHVLEGISFRVKHGEIISLLGPSAAGKSTLLKIIAGLLKPIAGQIFIENTDQTNIPTYKRNLGYVFQNPNALFPHLNVFENVAFPFKKGNKNINKVNYKIEVAKILDITGLGPFKKSSITNLSGGQLQRVALARSLVYKPSLLLLDEPLGALDNILKDSMLDLLIDLHNEYKTTFIYVTHDEREALRISTHMAILADKKMYQYGKTIDIFNRPASRIVCKIIGGWNILNLKNVKESNPLFKIVNDYNLYDINYLGIPISKIKFYPSKKEVPECDIKIPIKITSITPWQTGFRLDCMISGSTKIVSYYRYDKVKVGDMGYLTFKKEDCHDFKD